MGDYWIVLNVDSNLENELIGENQHITVKYLGEELEEKNVIKSFDLFKRVLTSRLSRKNGIEYTIKGTDVFGEHDVILLESASLQRFHFIFNEMSKSYDAYREDDFPQYNPHITVKEISDIKHLKGIKYNSGEFTLYDGDIILDQFNIMKGK